MSLWQLRSLQSHAKVPWIRCDCNMKPSKLQQPHHCFVGSNHGGFSKWQQINYLPSSLSLCDRLPTRISLTVFRHSLSFGIDLCFLDFLEALHVICWFHKISSRLSEFRFLFETASHQLTHWRSRTGMPRAGLRHRRYLNICLVSMGCSVKNLRDTASANSRGAQRANAFGRNVDHLDG